jgi:tetratricopeptide (TPR) repeat protein
MALAAVILAEPVSASRQGRRQSSSRSSARSSASGHSSRSNSNRASRPSISTRSVPRSNGNISGRTARSSRSNWPSSRATPNTRNSRIYSPSISQSDISTSGLRNSGLRPSRRSDSRISRSTSDLNRRRIDRTTGHYDYPSTRRSYYHYHRDYYPSHRIFYWISWPDCCRPICYDWGLSFSFGYFWPYYHRRFVFVSLGGYWPAYTYRRYYWYGWHPYRWYGYYPPEYVIAGNTYNYYYYNTAPQGKELDKANKKFEENAPARPAEETPADRDFEAAVKDFGAGDYAAATAKFHDAMQSAPEDIVVPFAYTQALFASGQYQKAAEALRQALLKSSPQQEGVFYPRGLYSDESILNKQIQQLEEAVEQNPVDANLRLLLGYQLLGMGKLDEASEQLESARLNSHTNQAAGLLIDVLEKNKKARNSKPDSIQEQKQPEKPATPAPTESKDKNAANAARQDIDLPALAMTADKWLGE